MPPRFDEIDREILRLRQTAFDKRPGARVGDWVIMPDGSRQRFTYDWDDSLQITLNVAGDGSFYLGDMGLDFSGGLDRPLPRASLVDTGETAPGPVWFFHHNRSEGGNGVYTNATFRVFRYDPGQPG